MPGPLTIAFAYGASDVSSKTAETAFRANLKGSWTWASVDWRDRGCLLGPDENQLRYLGSRFDDAEDAAAAHPDAVAEAPRTDLAAQPVGTSAGGPAPEPPTIAVQALGESAPAEVVVHEGFLQRVGIPIGAVVTAIGFLARVGFDPRKAMREGYRLGLDSVATTLADILNYLATRDGARQCVVNLVRETIDEASGTVVFVGESLGGMMLVDALAYLKASAAGGDPADIDRLAKVGLLVTFASQTAALRQIRPGGTPPGPPPFTPWVNVWNPDDFLSYPIEGSYEELNSGHPAKRAIDYVAGHKSLFPDVHSSYKSDPASRLFDYIRQELTARGLAGDLEG